MYSENKKKFLIFFFKPFFLFGPAILSAQHSKSARTPSTPRPAPTRRSNPPARPRACHGAHLGRAAPHPTGTLAGVRHHHTAGHPSQVRNDLSLPRPLKTPATSPRVSRLALRRCPWVRAEPAGVLPLIHRHEADRREPPPSGASQGRATPTEPLPGTNQPPERRRAWGQSRRRP
jgi:hypothetical protein